MCYMSRSSQGATTLLELEHVEDLRRVEGTQSEMQGLSGQSMLWLLTGDRLGTSSCLAVFLKCDWLSMFDFDCDGDDNRLWINTYLQIANIYIHFLRHFIYF